MERRIGLVLESSVGYLELDPRGRNISGSFDVTENGTVPRGSWSYPGARLGHNLSALSLGMRVGFTVLPWLYVGGAYDVGLGSERLPATTANGFAVAATSHGVNGWTIEGDVFAGLRLPLGYVAFRAEAFFGGRLMQTSQSARRPAGRSALDATSELDMGVIGPRFCADFWFDPQFTVSVFAGFNALKVGDNFRGLLIGFHALKYDGAFLLW